MFLISGDPLLNLIKKVRSSELDYKLNFLEDIFEIQIKDLSDKKKLELLERFNNINQHH
jgi:hypothetical protein